MYNNTLPSCRKLHTCEVNFILCNKKWVPSGTHFLLHIFLHREFQSSLIHFAQFFAQCFGLRVALFRCLIHLSDQPDQRFHKLIVDRVRVVIHHFLQRLRHRAHRADVQYIPLRAVWMPRADTSTIFCNLPMRV